MPSLSQRIRQGSRPEQKSVNQDVKMEVQRLFAVFRSEMMQEIRRVLLETVGEEGSIQIKGDRGYSPQKGVDYNDGQNGRDGRDGVDGKDGRDGKDADPDKVADIVIRRLEKKAKKAVKVQEVEGLEDLLRALDRKAGSGGGGGMGNVVHKHSSISSATTTITLDSKIAGGGFAIWAFYNGQMVARGTDYTVGADFKTLTLSFTPSDSTVFDVVYIRG